MIGFIHGKQVAFESIIFLNKLIISINIFSEKISVLCIVHSLYLLFVWTHSASKNLILLEGPVSII
jgi:hypothetical protein